VASVKAIDEPPSLIDLRERVEAMMPRVDISGAVVEVPGWCPKFRERYQYERDGVVQAAGSDLVFVNLFHPPLGEPMKYDNAHELSAASQDVYSHVTDSDKRDAVEMVAAARRQARS
jgi:hypothetical protein